MKYQCQNCNQIFTHPEKNIDTRPFPYPTQGTETIEKYLCPFCHSLNFTEYVESQPEIDSVKSVPLEEVDAWLAKGYQVRELYAKSATLVRLKATPMLQDACVVQAEAAYKKLEASQ